MRTTSPLTTTTSGDAARPLLSAGAGRANPGLRWRRASTVVAVVGIVGLVAPTASAGAAPTPGGPAVTAPNRGGPSAEQHPTPACGLASRPCPPSPTPVPVVPPVFPGRLEIDPCIVVRAACPIPSIPDLTGDDDEADDDAVRFPLPEIDPDTLVPPDGALCDLLPGGCPSGSSGDAEDDSPAAEEATPEGGAVEPTAEDPVEPVADGTADSGVEPVADEARAADGIAEDPPGAAVVEVVADVVIGSPDFTG